MASSAQQRVLVVDDDREMCAMLDEYLSREGFAVDVAHDGPAALRALRDQDPQIVLLDVSMPGLNGFEVLQQLRLQSALPVLMLTARDDYDDRVRGLDLGADDYLTKPFDARELVARIHAILRRSQSSGSADSAELLQVGSLALETGLRRVRSDGEAVALTDAEYLVLEVLVRSCGKVVTRAELTRRALGRRLVGLDRSIDTHVSNLRRKLGPAAERSTPILAIRGAGYMLGRPPADRGE